MNLGFDVQTCQHFIKKVMNILMVIYCSHTLLLSPVKELLHSLN